MRAVQRAIRKELNLTLLGPILVPELDHQAGLRRHQVFLRRKFHVTTNRMVKANCYADSRYVEISHAP